LRLIIAAALAATCALALPPPAMAAGSVLNAGESLQNAALTSANGEFVLNMQSDGNLVALIWPRPYWSLGGSGANARLTVQTDGNLVVYRSDGGVAWAANKFDPAGSRLLLQDDGNIALVGNSKGLLWSPNAVPTRLYTGQALVGARSHAIYSPDRRYRMVLQPDGTAVVYDQNTAIWSKHGNQLDTTLELQSDANLVLYNSSHSAVWASNKFGPDGSYLEGQNDGNFVVYTPARAALWSTKGDTTVDVGGSTTAGRLIAGADRDLAQKIINSGRVSGDSKYIQQIKSYAAGDFRCHINPTILSVIYTSVAAETEGGLGHRIYISSLNRKCTDVITSSGTSSYHYRDGGGHAVDIAIIDGQASTGSTTNDLALLRQLMTRLPNGSGFGQSNCRPKSALALPAGVTEFSDTCNHDHIQVPIK